VLRTAGSNQPLRRRVSNDVIDLRLSLALHFSENQGIITI